MVLAIFRENILSLNSNVVLNNMVLYIVLRNTWLTESLTGYVTTDI